jgi:DNA-binding SARP family transcriptional activator
MAMAMEYARLDTCRMVSVPVQGGAMCAAIGGNRLRLPPMVADRGPHAMCEANGARASSGAPRGGGVSAGARLQLLGGFELVQDGREVPLPWTAQRVLAFLALQRRPVRRPYVAGLLWLESDEGRSSGSLRSAIWRLRRPACDLVEAVSGHLRVACTVVVDVHEVVAAASRLEDPTADLNGIPELISTLDGELLPDWYDDWVLMERERLRQIRLHALENMCRRLVAERRYGRAVDAGLAAVRAEPLRESAHRALIEAHLAEGNHGEAVRQYQAYRGVLMRELGDTAPSTAMKELIGTITRR